MTRALVVFVTCPPRKAAALAEALVRRRVAACVNVVAGVRSWFWWEGRVDRAGESLLIIKTAARRLPQLQRAILSLHPYEVPEIIALPISGGHPAYVRWVVNSSR